MDKKLIRLTENDLHRIVKASVKRIVKENLYRNKNGKLIWEPAEETKYSIGPEGPNGWPNLLNKDDRSETGYQIYGWEELPDDKRRYSVWNSIARNSEDFIPEQKMHKIVKESVEKILSESDYDNFFDWADNSSASPEEIKAASKRHDSRIPSIKSPTDKLARRERTFSRRASMNDPDIGERIANRKDFIKNQRQGEDFRQRITK